MPVDLSTKDFLISRQPVFNNKQEVVSYDILLSNNPYALLEGDKSEDSLQIMDDIDERDKSTIEDISNILSLLGIKKLTNGKQAFFRLTETLINNGYAKNLPKETSIIVFPDKITNIEKTVKSAEKLKSLGHTTASNMFTLKHLAELGTLFQYIDIILIDFVATDRNTRNKISTTFQKSNTKLMATRIEEKEEFKEALSLGFSFFQGYFFARPEIVSEKQLSTLKINHLSLIREASAKDIDFKKIEQIVKQDVALIVKLLKYINSAYFGLQREVKSIGNALVLLGENELRRWIVIASIVAIADDKPNELVRLALIRARFLEKSAPILKLNEYSQDLFFLGLFSLIEPITGNDLQTILSDMPINKEISNALLGHDNIFKTVLNLILAYEKGEWDKFYDLCTLLEIDSKLIPNLYFESVEWAQATFR